MKTKPPRTYPVCPACKTDWALHLGIAGTCAKLAKARRALAYIEKIAASEKPLEERLELIEAVAVIVRSQTK